MPLIACWLLVLVQKSAANHHFIIRLRLHRRHRRRRRFRPSPRLPSSAPDPPRSTLSSSRHQIVDPSIPAPPGLTLASRIQLWTRQRHGHGWLLSCFCCGGFYYGGAAVVSCTWRMGRLRKWHGHKAELRQLHRHFKPFVFLTGKQVALSSASSPPAAAPEWIRSRSSATSSCSSCTRALLPDDLAHLLGYIEGMLLDQCFISGFMLAEVEI
jgi:hypothetical protein